MPLVITDWKSPANIIANVIAEMLPEVFTFGTNLFVGVMPDKPNNCVVVIDSGGGEQDSVNAIDNCSIQIYSRYSSYVIGYNLHNLIKASIQSIEPTIFDEEIIIGLWVKSNIAFLGRDESERSLFSSNYRVLIDTKKDSNRFKDNDTWIDGGNANSF